MGKYEIDHKKPLCRGGTNDLDNLQALCPFYHAGKTQDEQQDTSRMHTIESQLSPLLWKELHKCPKPVEVSWGTTTKTEDLKKKLAPRRLNEKGREKLKRRLDWAKKALKSTKAKHVMDLLMGRAKPQTVATKRPIVPDGISELLCMDAKSCRVFALTKQARQGLAILFAARRA